MRAIALGALLLVGAGMAPPSSARADSERSAAELMDAVMWNREPIGGPFALIDHTGKPRTEADFRGRFLLLYFGFTYCPDVCPTDLQAMGLALDQLGAAGDAVQPLFVTLDPDRDTPRHLADYVPLFHPRLIGLSGDEPSVRQAAAVYKVYHARMAMKDGAYTIDHSGFIYLMDRDGRYLGFFPPGTPPDQMAAAIRPLIGRGHQP